MMGTAPPLPTAATTAAVTYRLIGTSCTGADATGGRTTRPAALHPRKIVVVAREARERVLRVRVEARADEDRVGRKAADRGQQRLAPRAAELRRAGARGQRAVYDASVAARAPGGGACPGVARRLVARGVQHVRVGPGACGVAVPVVHVKIEDGDALHVVRDARVCDANHDVVEHAEAHRPLWLGVVAGRPHHHKGAPGLAGCLRAAHAHAHVVDSGDHQPCRSRGGSTRARARDGVPIDNHREPESLGTRAGVAHAPNMGLRVHPKQLLARDVSFGLANAQILPELTHPATHRSKQPLEPCGRLWMTTEPEEPRVVLEADGRRVECHRAQSRGAIEGG
mmetsp:Transcript_33317/g.108960  ORF Transcript_33317/g.108960 Transcript_33317/m.108960 type:complete len:339 (+) Transcript_33317:292-1308(+)